jgi:hypothetical protein
MVLAKKFGMTFLCIKDFTKMPLKRAKENTVGLMEIDSLGNGIKTSSREKDYFTGIIIECT